MATSGETRTNQLSVVFEVDLSSFRLFCKNFYQTTCVVIFIILYLAIPILVYPVINYLLFWSNHKILSWTMILPYLTWIFYIDRDCGNRGGRTMNWVRRWNIWRGYCDYFPIKIVKTCDLDPKRNYLFCSHPHGTFPCGVLGCFPTEGADIKKHFPGLSFHLLTLGVNFYFPILREMLLSLGFCNASKKGMRYLLSKPGGGVAAALTPGGVIESWDSRPGTCVVHLKRRKGFVRVAIQTGAWLVPVFHFGETETYSQVANPKGSWLRAMQETLEKNFQQGPPLFIGKGRFGILPFRGQLTLVVGAPIQVDKVEEPSEELVNEVHQKYTDALVKLFHDHKDKYVTDPNYVLTIV